MFCSTLGAGTPVPGPANEGGGGPAAAAIAGDIAPMLPLPPSDATPPLPDLSSGESKSISSGEVPALLPGVPPAKLVEDGLLVLAACAVAGVEGVVVVGAATVEEAEALEEDEMM
jgi:hypothetical protein